MELERKHALLAFQDLWVFSPGLQLDSVVGMGEDVTGISWENTNWVGLS